MLGGFIILISLIVFILSLAFYAKSDGQKQCTNPISDLEQNKTGGIVGMSLAGLLFLFGLIVKFTRR